VFNKITSAFSLVSKAGNTTRNNKAPFGFYGGLCLDNNKRALRGNNELLNIVEIEPPELLTIPLINYQKQSLTPKVHLHDQVDRGQALAEGIVSPVSGVVEAIQHQEIIHPGGLRALSVVIRNDGLDKPICMGATTHNNRQAQALEQERAQDQEQARFCINDYASAQDKIANFVAHPALVLDHAALVGLGGAGFPTAQKLLPTDQAVQTLIINAAECEPEIACDEALMQSSSEQIACGISALVQLTGCKKCIVAIEDSKTLAIESMRAAIGAIGAIDKLDHNIELLVIPTRYPAGAQSPLIQNVTGRFIPHNVKPIAYGVLCINVATAHALWQAINGQPLDSRIISLGGTGMPNPCNVRVRFGTPVSYVLKQSGNAHINSSMRIRAGGPLSGFDLHTTDVSITATTNCILAEPTLNEPPAQPCIRCNDCADVCPARLQPQQLYWYTQSAEHDKCEEFQLDACIECGCCDLVCPASIKLTETFRFEKSNLNFIKAQQKSAAEAEQRFSERESRLKLKEQVRQRAIEQRKKKVKSQKQPDSNNISAALARARKKRNLRQD